MATVVVVTNASRTVEYAGFVGRNFDRHVTKFAPRKALKLIASGKLTFDERVVLHRADCG